MDSESALKSRFEAFHLMFLSQWALRGASWCQDPDIETLAVSFREANALSYSCKIYWSTAVAIFVALVRDKSP